MQRVREVAAAPRVRGAGLGQGLGGGGVGQQLEQHPLQQAARPARPEQPAGHQLAEQVIGPPDRGEAEIRPEGLGEALHQDRPGREVPAEADQRAGRDVAGVVVLEHPRAGRRQQVGQRPGPADADAHAERVVGPGLEVDGDRPAGQCGLQRIRDGAMGVDGDRDDLRADGVEQVEHGREGRLLHEHDVAQPNGERGQAVERVHCAVDDGEAAGRERPALPQEGLQVGEHRVGQVALGQRPPGDPGQRGAEPGQQLRIGCAEREVEGERPRPRVHAPVAARAPAARLGADVGAVAPSGLQHAGPTERLPGLVHRGRADAEGLRQGPHGGQPRAGSQLAGRHQPADRGGDRLGRDPVDAPGQVAGGQRGGGVHGANVPEQNVDCCRSFVRLRSRPSHDATQAIDPGKGARDGQRDQGGAAADRLDGRQGVHDRQARGGGTRGIGPGSAGHLLPGAVLRALLLPGAGGAVLRVHRGHPGRPDHAALPEPWPRSSAW